MAKENEILSVLDELLERILNLTAEVKKLTRGSAAAAASGNAGNAASGNAENTSRGDAGNAGSIPASE